MTTERVLVLGGGAREHALAWRLSREAEVHIAPGNAGSEAVATRHSVDLADVGAVVALAQRLGATLVVVGPEAPLTLGVVDALAEASIAAFGPSQAAARLEGSKIFSKELMKRAGVPTAAFEVFDDAEAAKEWILQQKRPLVVKADGLAAGKGVVVASDAAEACAAVDQMMIERAFGEAGARVLIEDVLVGQEVSYHVICDGERYIALAAAQDHKRAFDGDQGPNTGGMGAYSPVPIVDDALEAQVLRTVVEPTLQGMRSLGCPFRGVLFVGLMVHEGRASVLEFNVRFGDPECEVLMARWGGPLLPVLRGAASGELTQTAPTWDAPAALCVVLASGGYPGTYAKGVEIRGLNQVPGLDEVPGALVFHAGTERQGERIVTAGGRVLAITATGDDLNAAAARAYATADGIEFEGKQLRRDIGWQARS